MMKLLRIAGLFQKILPQTIRGQLRLWFLVLSVAPILIISMVAYKNSRASLEQEVINKLKAVADNKTFTLKGWLQTNLSDVQKLAGHRALKELLAPASRAQFSELAARTPKEKMQRVKDLITALQETNPSYVDVLVVDKEGRVIASSSTTLGQEGKSLSETGMPKIEMFQAFLSPVFFSPTARQHVLMISSPIHDHEVSIVGHAVLEVELLRIHQLIGERSGLGETGEVILVDRERRMLTQSRFSQESTILKSIPENNPIRLGLQGNRGEAFDKDYRGVRAASSYRPISELQAVLIAKIDEAEGLAPVTRLRDTVLVIIVLTTLLALAASLVLARVISRPIREGVGFAHRVAQGDLTATLVATDASEISQLAGSLNQMVEDLKHMVMRITEVVQNTTAAASQISAAVDEQERTIASQAASVNEITATVHELAQTSNQVGKTAEEVAGQWKEALEVADEGNRSVQKGIEEMSLIKTKAEGVAKSILNLSEQIQRINSIVHTVASIAEQTNMLALNAGIEAARAGEHGRGFAVVATEVRKLADQSQKAAAQIGAIIQEIQSATHSTIMAVEEGTKGVEAGVRQVLQAGETIQSVTSTIKRTVEAVHEISLATRQQAIGVDQVSEAMQNIDQGMKETVAGTKETNVAASQLVVLGQALQELVKKFQVADGAHFKNPAAR